MAASAGSAAVDFSVAAQSLDPLKAAAYRLIGVATCQIDRVGDRWVCQLAAVSEPGKKAGTDIESLRTRFLDLVTDENLRERIAARTLGERNVILSLAFGSLAKAPADPG